MSEEKDIDDFTTIKTCIIRGENKKALEFYLGDMAQAKQEAEREQIRKMLDPEIIAKYGKTQAERRAINTYLRCWLSILPKEEKLKANHLLTKAGPKAGPKQRKGDT